MGAYKNRLKLLNRFESFTSNWYSFRTVRLIRSGHVALPLCQFLSWWLVNYHFYFNSTAHWFDSVRSFLENSLIFFINRIKREWVLTRVFTSFALYEKTSCEKVVMPLRDNRGEIFDKKPSSFVQEFEELHIYKLVHYYIKLHHVIVTWCYSTQLLY